MRYKYHVLITPRGATPVRDRERLERRICGEHPIVRLLSGGKRLYCEPGGGEFNYIATCLAGERCVSVRGYALLCVYDEERKSKVGMDKPVAQALCDGINLMNN